MVLYIYVLVVDYTKLSRNRRITKIERKQENCNEKKKPVNTLKIKKTQLKVQKTAAESKVNEDMKRGGSGKNNNGA